MVRDIPAVSMEEFVALVERYFPDASIEAGVVNSAHGSWEADVSRETASGKGEIYVLWCPLTGFGGSDFRRLGPDELGDAFRPYDEGFSGIGDVEAFLFRGLGD